MTRSGAEPGSVDDLHALEISEVLQASLGPIDERAIVGVALRQVELAPDHVIARARIAAHIDPLDVGALPLLDAEDEVDPPVLDVARRARTHRREGKAPLRGLDGHVLDGLLDRFGIVDVARIGPQPRSQERGVERPHSRLHIDRSDPVLLALLDREGDHESSPCRIEFPDRGYDAHIDVAVLEIKPAQQLAIRLDPVRIIDVAGLQECENSGLRGLDHVLEPERRVGAVADELDGLDAGLCTLGDFEDEIDAIIGKLDDLGLDPDIETAAAPVDLDQACHVRLHHRTRERAALLRLDFGLELLVLDLLVALEGNAIDDRVFDDREDQPAALDRRPDVPEQAGRVERLHAFVDLEASSRPPGPGRK